MNKIQWFNEWSQLEKDYVDTKERFLDFYTTAKTEILDGTTEVLKSNVISLYIRDKEELMKEKEIIGELERIYGTELMDELKSMEKYSPYNPFIKLKMLVRKINGIYSTQHEYKQYFRDLLQRIKKLEKETTIKFKFKEKKRLERYFKIKFEINNILENLNVNNFVNFNNYLPVMFGPWKMPKNDFLSLINVDRNLYTWDGEKNNTFNIIRDLPDEIGFKEFEEAIFLNSIEEHKNNYFFQLFMKEALSLMKTKGENAFDLFEKVSQRPLSTYTVEEDVYGDVISVKRNKPNLKLLNNWTK